MHTKQRVLVLPRGDHLQKMGEREGISGKFAVSISFLTDHFCSFDCVAVRCGATIYTAAAKAICIIIS